MQETANNIETFIYRHIRNPHFESVSTESISMLKKHRELDYQRRAYHFRLTKKFIRYDEGLWNFKNNIPHTYTFRSYHSSSSSLKN
jgi:hypothetical protein